MALYEILIENITPCGGEQYAKRELIEAELDDPESYVRETSPFPLAGSSRNADGDLVITAADSVGNTMRFTFFPC